MRTDIFGQQIFDENDLCDLYLKNTTRSLKNVLVEKLITFDPELNLVAIPELIQYSETHKSIEEFETKLKDYDYYARMFNFPDEVVGCSKNLEMIKSEILAVTNLWNHIRKCDS